MEKKDIEFVDGLIVKAPRDGAPDFVKATISIKVEDLGKWLREKYKAKEEWVNIGRDHTLERQILDSIKNQSAATQPTQ